MTTQNLAPRTLITLMLLGVTTARPAQSPSAIGDEPAPPAHWDVFSDTWVATDALGRSLPDLAEVGPPRAGRQVGVFYFLWHGAHIQGGPYDITRILERDPEAMRKKESPLWGPLHAPHHWGESLFGYYLTDDAFVLRKHAQMLSDVGVDAIFFDVSNQVTYRPYYLALLRVFSEFRQYGGRPPQVAFLCPFWDPAKVARELYRDLYEPRLYPELWFHWEGKPLILADPAMLTDREGNEQQNSAAELAPGQTLGQSFWAGHSIAKVGGRFPTWRSAGSAFTLTLYRDGPGGSRVASRRFEDVQDNEWLMLSFQPPLSPGTYYLEMSAPKGQIGWWSHSQDVLARGQAFTNGQPAAGDRTLRLLTTNPETRRLLDFFTFRKPQPDYFRGPTGPDQWSWLEVYPQHLFTNSLGQKEQMSVGVAQNAAGGRLATLSEPGARGRSFHDGATDARPGAVRHGFNVAEQWARALQEDPPFIFVTGWNEWIAGRFDEFNGVRLPVMFVDQFDQEHSRDIEPMRGGHGDSYYYQLAGYIRRYKGVRATPKVTARPIRVDGRLDDWREVQPEFRDTLGDPAWRQHRGWNPQVTYTNFTGRNDLSAAKVSFDEQALFFHVRTREALTPCTDSNWMWLFLDVDADARTGWLGYDFVANRTRAGDQQASLERNVGGQFRWSPAGEIAFRAAVDGLELRVPFAAMGLSGPPAALDFKWADNLQQTGEWSDFTLHGDAAPNDRFNYRARLK